MRLLAQWRALRDASCAEFNKQDEDTEDSDAPWAERDRIEALLYTTPAKTAAGIRAQIMWVIEDSGGAFVCVGHLEALSLSAFQQRHSHDHVGPGGRPLMFRIGEAHREQQASGYLNPQIPIHSASTKPR